MRVGDRIISKTDFNNFVKKNEEYYITRFNENNFCFDIERVDNSEGVATFSGGFIYDNFEKIKRDTKPFKIYTTSTGFKVSRAGIDTYYKLGELFINIKEEIVKKLSKFDNDKFKCFLQLDINRKKYCNDAYFSGCFRELCHADIERINKDENKMNFIEAFKYLEKDNDNVITPVDSSFIYKLGDGKCLYYKNKNAISKDWFIVHMNCWHHLIPYEFEIYKEELFTFDEIIEEFKSCKTSLENKEEK
jgi:hypothetical protein